MEERPTIKNRPPVDFKTDGFIEAQEKFINYQADKIKELEDERLNYTIWLIEELDNRMIDKVTDEDAESFINDWESTKN